MMKKIALLHGDGIGPKLVNAAKDIIAFLGKKYNLQFSFFDFSVGGENIDKENESISNSTLSSLKSMDAIILGTLGGEKWNFNKVTPESALIKIINYLNLYSKIQLFPFFAILKDKQIVKENKNGLITLVTDSISGICKNQFEYTSTESGRGAYDKITYSELEIEKVARSAYELADNFNYSLTLLDESNSLLTGRLFRKIVTDINEDYPSIKVNTFSAGSILNSLIKNNNEILLASNIIEAPIREIIKTYSYNLKNVSTSYIGENLLGLYTISGDNDEMFKNTEIINPIPMLLSVANMFNLSFNRLDITKALLKSTYKVINDNNLPYELGGENKLNEIIEKIKRNI